MKIELDDVAYLTETSVTIRESRRRTTVPKGVTERLALEDGDKLRWILLKNGTLILMKVNQN